MTWSTWFHEFGWIMAIGAVWIGAAILHVVIQWICNYSYRRLSGSDRPHALVLATLPLAAIVPLITLVWVLAAIISLEILFQRGFACEQSVLLIQLRKFAVLGLVAWWILRWNRMAQNRLRQRVEEGDIGVELTHLDLASKLISLFVLFVAFLLALQIAGIDIRAIITLSGFGAIALGLAGRDVFANLFAGIMVYLTRPFKVGETISIVDKRIEGEVERIGWYLTRIRDVDKRPQYLPNSLFSTAVITNQSRMTGRRLECTLGLRYRDLPLVPSIIEEIRSMLANLEEIDRRTTSQVWFTALGNSSVKIFVRAYTATSSWTSFLKSQQEFLTQCARIVHQHGADFAFPTTTIEVDKIPVQLIPPV